MEALDGSIAQSGDLVTIVVERGDGDPGEKPATKKMTGTLRAFRPNDDQIAELEAKLAALQADNATRWEIDTGTSVVGVDPSQVRSIVYTE